MLNSRINPIESFDWTRRQLALTLEDMVGSDSMEQATDASILHRVSRIVSSELSLDEMLGEIVGLTAQVAGCDACLVYLVDFSTDEFVLRASQVPHAADLGHLRMKI